MKKKRYWCSWEQPTEDYRPLTFPPNKGVLGWWNSGSVEGYWTIVALVEARHEDEAFLIIEKDWPEIVQWRFIEEINKDWRPNDRFVIEKGSWIEERINSK